MRDVCLLIRPVCRRCFAALLVVVIGAGAVVSVGDASEITIRGGFAVEKLHDVDPDTEGSWVSLTVDPQGRLIASDQYGKLYRIDVHDGGSESTAQELSAVTVQPLKPEIGSAQGLLYAHDSLYVMVNKEHESGLYRLRDTTEDDQFDSIERLLTIEGAGEHGPHGLTLAPDGKSIYFCCGNHTEIPELADSRLPENWDEDLLLPRLWDANGHATGRMAPGGFICRVDLDGRHCELIAAGFRNAYDLAFNADGELFTYDSDMEWDIGLPWYRPTRILHAISGAEFGWRSGSGKWPTYYPDSLPAVVDVGQGSPTGIIFGRGTKFPAEYQRALFACDWSYGILYAVHIVPAGASYTGKLERFAFGSPFPVTDIVVRPQDGALYVTTGGRRVQSALYRIRYVGSANTDPIDEAAADDDLAREASRQRALRHSLEQFHVADAVPEDLDQIWPYLGSDDRHIRYAARIVLEQQPWERWKHRALAARDTDEVIQSALAWARSGQLGDPAEVLERVGSLDEAALSDEQRLAALRVVEVVLARAKSAEITEELRRSMAARLSPLYPAEDPRLNRELCELLIYLHAPTVVGKTLDLLDQAASNLERIQYLLRLRCGGLEWSLDQRREYLRWFSDAAANAGGNSYAGFVKNILAEALEDFDATEQQQLAKEIAAALQPAPQKQYAPRAFVKHWTIDEILQASATTTTPDVAHGRQLFGAAQCYQCHRFQGVGSQLAPDLTAAVGRFDLRDLLKSIIEPNSSISDQYQMTNFELRDGRVISGRIINLNGETYRVLADLLQPNRMEKITANQIERMSPSAVSAMPSGLLDTLELHEILDLLAFLRSGREENATQPAASRRAASMAK